MAKEDTSTVNFRSNATIYKSGSGHGFPPGSRLSISAAHAVELRARGKDADAPAKKAAPAVPAAPPPPPADALARKSGDKDKT